MNKKIIFCFISIILALIILEGMLQIVYFFKRLSVKNNHEWKYTETEKTLVNLHEKRGESGVKIGDCIISPEMFIIKKDDFYYPKPNSSIAVIKNDKIGPICMPYNALTKELLSSFNGDIYIWNFDELSLRKTINDSKNLSDIQLSIIVLVDSFQGSYVNDEDTFSSQIEENARKNGIKLKVYNAGVAGYNTKNEYCRLTEVLPRLNIDIIILNHFPNDINVVEHKVIGYWRPREPQNALGKWIFDHIIMARLIMEGYYSVCDIKFNPSENKEIQEGWRESFNYLEKIRDICEEKNIKFIVSVIPSKEQFKYGLKENYQNKIQKFCQDRNITFIDPYDSFEKYGYNKLYLNWDPHFTKEGHEVYGKFIYSQIKDIIEKYKK